MKIMWRSYMLWLVTGSLLVVRFTSAAHKFDLRERSNSASGGFFKDGAKWNDSFYVQKVDIRSIDEPELREAHLDNFLDRLTLILNARPTNTSTRCQWDVYRTQQGIKNGKTWALSMIDSFGKPGSGIFKGHLSWPGSYSQCRSVKSQDDDTEHGSSFSGLYCWLNLKPVSSEMVNSPVWEIITVKTGICFPDSCSEEEVSELIQKSGLFHYIEDYWALKDISCIVPRPPIWEDSKALSTLVFILLLVLLMSVGTVYDLMTNHFCCCDQRINLSRFSELQPAKKMVGNESLDDSNDYYKKETTTHNDESETQNCGTGSTLLLAFSVRRNGKNLFKMSDGRDALPALNGIRFFSLVWIILFHTWIFFIDSGIVDNAKTFGESFEDYFVQSFVNQTLGVDSFLLLRGKTIPLLLSLAIVVAPLVDSSNRIPLITYPVPNKLYALLVTYNYLKKSQKREKKSWTRFYIDRYCRFTITYGAVMFLIYGNLWLHLGDGPFWDPQYVGTEHCYKDWWKNLLYINNFFKDDLCMKHGWYLSVDMQFFILTPLFLIAMERYRFLAVSLFAAFLVATWTTTLILASIVKPIVHFRLKAFTMENEGELYHRIYVKPYCRLGPYLVGMICGWVLHKTQRNAVMKKKWVFIGWAVAAICMLTVLLGKAIDDLNYSIFYTAFNRSVWAIGVSWVIFACCNGYGGMVTRFLNFPLWNVISRLTYCAYLVQLNVLFFLYGNTDVTQHFEGGTSMGLWFITNVICTYVLAAVVYLAVEAPFTIIHKMIFR